MPNDPKHICPACGKWYDCNQPEDQQHYLGRQDYAYCEDCWILPCSEACAEHLSVLARWLAARFQGGNLNHSRKE